MDYVNHWIPRPSFPTRLYHLHPCRRACAGRLRASCPLAAYRTSSAACSRRRSTTCIHAGVSINDGRGWDRKFPGIEKGYRNDDKPILPPVVIPAKAGIQEGEAGGEGMAEFIGYPHLVIVPVIVPVVVIPALREWIM